jgi:hypothetical protein
VVPTGATKGILLPPDLASGSESRQPLWRMANGDRVRLPTPEPEASGVVVDAAADAAGGWFFVGTIPATLNLVPVHPVCAAASRSLKRCPTSFWFSRNFQFD